MKMQSQSFHWKLYNYSYTIYTIPISFLWPYRIPDLGSGAMICGVLFSISSVADHVMTPKFFHVVFFYSGLIIQLYSNCFYGSQVFVAVRRKICATET